MFGNTRSAFARPLFNRSDTADAPPPASGHRTSSPPPVVAATLLHQAEDLLPAAVPDDRVGEKAYDSGHCIGSQSDGASVDRKSPETVLVQVEPRSEMAAVGLEEVRPHHRAASEHTGSHSGSSSGTTDTTTRSSVGAVTVAAGAKRADPEGPPATTEADVGAADDDAHSAAVGAATSSVSLLGLLDIAAASTHHHTMGRGDARGDEEGSPRSKGVVVGSKAAMSPTKEPSRQCKTGGATRRSKVHSPGKNAATATAAEEGGGGGGPKRQPSAKKAPPASGAGAAGKRTVAPRRSSVATSDPSAVVVPSPMKAAALTTDDANDDGVAAAPSSKDLTGNGNLLQVSEQDPPPPPQQDVGQHQDHHPLVGEMLVAPASPVSHDHSDDGVEILHCVPAPSSLPIDAVNRFAAAAPSFSSSSSGVAAVAGRKWKQLTFGAPTAAAVHSSSHQLLTADAPPSATVSGGRQTSPLRNNPLATTTIPTTAIRSGVPIPASTVIGGNHYPSAPTSIRANAAPPTIARGSYQMVPVPAAGGGDEDGGGASQSLSMAAEGRHLAAVDDGAPLRPHNEEELRRANQQQQQLIQSLTAQLQHAEEKHQHSMTKAQAHLLQHSLEIATLRKTVQEKSTRIDDVTRQLDDATSDVHQWRLRCRHSEGQLHRQLLQYQQAMFHVMLDVARSTRKEARRVQYQTHFDLGQVLSVPAGPALGFGTGGSSGAASRDVWIHGNRVRELNQKLDDTVRRIKEVEAVKKGAMQKAKTAKSQMAALNITFQAQLAATLAAASSSVSSSSSPPPTTTAPSAAAISALSSLPVEFFSQQRGGGVGVAGGLNAACGGLLSLSPAPDAQADGNATTQPTATMAAIVEHLRRQTELQADALTHEQLEAEEFIEVTKSELQGLKAAEGEIKSELEKIEVEKVAFCKEVRRINEEDSSVYCCFTTIGRMPVLSPELLQSIAAASAAQVDAAARRPPLSGNPLASSAPAGVALLENHPGSVLSPTVMALQSTFASAAAGCALPTTSSGAAAGIINNNHTESNHPSSSVAASTVTGRYVLLHLLGKGGFSEVWKAFDLLEARYVACKIHHIQSSWTAQTRAHYLRHAERELEIQRHLSHVRVTKLFDVFQQDDNTFVSVMDFSGGEDLDLLLKRERTLKEADARIIMVQLLAALRHMAEQERPIIHYDLKPANILFHSEDRACIDIKVTDFGLSKIIVEQQQQQQLAVNNNHPGGGGAGVIELTSQGTGTYWYQPPECFEGPDPVTGAAPKITNKVDIWAAGVIFFQMLFGKKPFGDGESQRKIWAEKTIPRRARETLEFPSKPSVSADAKDVIRKMLSYKVDERPDVFTVSKEPYFCRGLTSLSMSFLSMSTAVPQSAASLSSHSCPPSIVNASPTETSQQQEVGLLNARKRARGGPSTITNGGTGMVASLVMPPPPPAALRA